MSEQPKRKILVIENQLYQFREIEKLLNEASFDVCPKSPEKGAVAAESKESTYVMFMDAVRTYLNPRFETKHSKACKHIVDYIDYVQPEMFIVDQVLVGNYHGEGGSTLANKILAPYNKPILFLSRTDPNRSDIRNDLDRLREIGIIHDWVNKGFSGLSILQPEYFKEYVVKDINRLLEGGDRRERLNRLLESMETGSFESDTDLLSELKENISAFSAKFPLDEPILTSTPLEKVVEKVIEKFAHFMVHGGLNTLLIRRIAEKEKEEKLGEKQQKEEKLGEKTQKVEHEKVSQLLFSVFADFYCELANIVVTRESRFGQSQIDFIFSKDYRNKMIVELKHDTNKKLNDTLTTQIPAYEDAYQTKKSILLVIKVSGEDKFIKKLDTHHKRLTFARKFPAPFRVIDATIKDVPSKRRGALVY